MSILIHGMKMPKDGECIVVYGDGEVWHHGKRIAKVGTAVELPQHGDLIDRAEIDKVYYDDEAFENGVGWLFEYIDKLTPVIPADPEEGGSG